jgi:hypothetical protein
MWDPCVSAHADPACFVGDEPSDQFDSFGWDYGLIPGGIAPPGIATAGGTALI